MYCSNAMSYQLGLYGLAVVDTKQYESLLLGKKVLAPNIIQIKECYHDICQFHGALYGRQNNIE